MNWEIQAIPGRCNCADCTSPEIHPGEPVRLNRVRRERWCWLCAWRRLQESVPRVDLPLQFVPKVTAAKSTGRSIYVAGGKSVEPNFETFDRQDMGATLRKGILSRRELERVNTGDGKLRAIGGDR